MEFIDEQIIDNTGFLVELFTISRESTVFEDIHEIASKYHPLDVINKAVALVIDQHINNFACMSIDRINKHTTIQELIKIATSKFNELTSISVSNILNIIDTNYVDNDIPDNQIYRNFVDCIGISHIIQYMKEYKRDVWFIRQLIGISKIVKSVNNLYYVNIIAKYDPYLANNIISSPYCNPNIYSAIIDKSIDILLSGNADKYIQHIVLENINSIIRADNVYELTQIFWATEKLIFTGKIYSYYHCQVAALISHLLKHKSFRDQYHKIRSLKDVAVFGIPPNSCVIGIQSGIMLNDESIIARSIDNIKKIKDGSMELPDTDDIDISIPINLLNKCSYQLLLSIYTRIKKADLISNVDPETIHDIEYLLANRECTICFTETTDLFIPPIIDKDIHRCSIIYCNICYSKSGSKCSVCKKDFTDENNDTDSDNDGEYAL